MRNTPLGDPSRGQELWIIVRLDLSSRFGRPKRLPDQRVDHRAYFLLRGTSHDLLQKIFLTPGDYVFLDLT